MRKHRVLKAVGICFVALAAGAVFGFAIEHLWNWLVPAVFGWRTITFWQAVGLFFLSRILFGGMHHRYGGRRGRCREGMAQRWQQMSPEEREKCRAKMGSWGRRFVPEAEPQA